MEVKGAQSDSKLNHSNVQRSPLIAAGNNKHLADIKFVACIDLVKAIRQGASW